MRGFSIFCTIGLFLAGSVACGGGKTDEAKQAAETAQQTAKTMQEFAKAMGKMQESPDGKTYEPVSFKELQNFFPDISGWEKEKPTGESMTAPVKFSQAETAYTKGDSRIEVKIVDTAMSKMLALPYQMFMMTGYVKESSSGYEKATKVGGNPGWEKWDSESKRAELGVIVGQRYIVTVEGSDTDIKTVQDVAGKIELGKLAGLK
jgi:hypothetical protein